MILEADFIAQQEENKETRLCAQEDSFVPRKHSSAQTHLGGAHLEAADTGTFCVAAHADDVMQSNPANWFEPAEGLSKQGD